MIFYHGTSDILDIGRVIKPASETGIKREIWKRNHKDSNIVYLTPNYDSALRYAKKACEMFGGNPIVYICKPGMWVNERFNNEFVCPFAYVKGIA